MVEKMNLFVILEALDQGQLDVFDQLQSDSAILKEFTTALGWLIPVWMTGAVNQYDHAHMIVEFNELCNRGWDRFKEFPNLRAKLLALCGPGRATKHRFFKPPTYKTGNALLDLLRISHPDIRPEQMDLWISKHTLEEARELAEMHGYQKDAIADVEKAYNGAGS